LVHASRPAGGSTLQRSAALWFTAIWATALVVLCLRKNHSWFYDDGFITLRYARHLADGLGPVWNRTGPPVEGFSSPLHLLLVALLIHLHINPLVAVRGLSFAFHAALVIFTWNFVRRSSGSMAAILAAALVAASWPMLIWDLGGLESVGFAALLATGSLTTLYYLESGKRRDIVLGGLLLGFAIFMRPDGAIVAAISLASCLFFGPGCSSRRTIDVLLSSALCGLVMLPWEIFRIRYFHAYLPNTYYAKVVGIPLAWRVHSGLSYWRTYIAKPPYFVPILALVVVLLLYQRRVSKFDLALWASGLGFALYIVDAGGDHMLGFRFMVPLVPLFAVAVARGLAELHLLERPPLAIAVSAVMMVACARQLTHWPQNPMFRDTAGMEGEEVGRYLDSRWKPGSVVALNVAGAMPYFADRLNYIDMLGLNDQFISRRAPVPMKGPWYHLIGHLKGDGQSVFNRKPDFVLLGGAQGRLATGEAPFLGDYELEHLPGFPVTYKDCVSTLQLSDFAFDQLQKAANLKSQQLVLTYYQRRDLPYPCDQIGP
jgi:arabinofuranosyltransferase